MINSIYEQRKRLKDGYHISLSIPKNEYMNIYGNEINDSVAQDIVHNYLQHRDDDGDPDDIKIYDHCDSNMIEIEARLNYLGNDHKEYE